MTCAFCTDDIPVRGFIGRLEEGNFIPHAHKVLFFTHHVFNIEYNEKQVSFFTVITLRASCDAVYCNRSCLFATGGRTGGVSLLPR